MKAYSVFDKEMKVYGIPFFDENKTLERLPKWVREELPSHMEHLGRRCPGARIEFKTNSRKIKVKLIFETLSYDIGMSIYSCQAAYVYIGSHTSSRYAGHVFPLNYDQKEVEKEFEKSDELEDVQIFVPRNEVMKDIIVEFEDDSVVESPTPYKYNNPILFYGSSITEGGCCSKISNSYSAMLSRRLDADYYNLGFSGSCKGEPVMAKYINSIDKSILVYDYDHNASNADELRKTHEPFFKMIREASPDLPVVFTTMPMYEKKDYNERTEIIRTTYENALKNGDKNVYFIDGGDFFPPDQYVYCSNDNTHPNDLGMFYMANAYEPVLKKILEFEK